MEIFGVVIEDKDYNQILTELKSLNVKYAIAFRRHSPSPTPPYYVLTTRNVFPNAKELSQETYNEIQSTIWVTKDYHIAGDITLFGVNDLPEPETK
jgi:hypothetical protein